LRFTFHSKLAITNYKSPILLSILALLLALIPMMRSFSRRITLMKSCDWDPAKQIYLISLS